MSGWSEAEIVLGTSFIRKWFVGAFLISHFIVK